MKIIAAILIGIGVGLVFTPAFAGEAHMSSQAYEQPAEQNTKRAKFNASNVENCFQAEVNLFEQMRGRLPNPDEADLFIDACMKLGHR